MWEETWIIQTLECLSWYKSFVKLSFLFEITNKCQILRESFTGLTNEKHLSFRWAMNVYICLYIHTCMLVYSHTYKSHISIEIIKYMAIYYVCIYIYIYDDRIFVYLCNAHVWVLSYANNFTLTYIHGDSLYIKLMNISHTWRMDCLSIEQRRHCKWLIIRRELWEWALTFLSSSSHASPFCCRWQLLLMWMPVPTELCSFA